MSLTDGKYRERLKIIVSCYACDPAMGSEPGMGGKWILQLARYHDLWVLTEQNRYAPALAAYLEHHCPELKAAIHIIGIPRYRFGEKLWEPFFYYWTYRRWQRDAYREAQRLLQEIKFDVVHHLNMIGYREPGYLWKLPVPFVWGPIGGHVQVPWRFLPALGRKGACQHGIRNLLNWIQMRSSFRVKLAMQRASQLLAATLDDKAAIRRIHKREALLLNEQAANPRVLQTEREPFDGHRPLRVVWCGNFGAGKALPLALRAIRRAAEEVSLELHIVGSGSCEEEWKTLAESLDVSSLCHWYGRLSHDRAKEIIGRSDVMLFTSLKEGTPAVVVEAIQTGVPVICHDKCGFGTVITERSGVKVPVKNPSVSISSFSEAMIRLAKNPDLLNSLSCGAIQRAEEISWPNQARIMLECYQRASNRSYDRSTIQTCDDLEKHARSEM